MTTMEIEQGEQLAASWRAGTGHGSPAGPLYTGGRYARADLRQRTGTGTARCGTACTWSQTRYCC